MSATASDVGAIAAIRVRLEDAGVTMRPATDDDAIARVLARCKGHAGVCGDAILMTPRPNWLRTLIGYDLMVEHPQGKR